MFCSIPLLPGLKAQDIDYFPNVEYITSNEGLSQSEVTSILQDKKGFLWIGTRGGLNRYDGKTIKSFQNKIGDPNSLINNSIENLFEDSKGNIWIGTKSNGVAKYNPQIDKFEEFGEFFDELKDKNVISIAEGKENEIWVGTRKNGLWVINEKDKSIHKLNQVNVVSSIYKTSQNKILVGTAFGLHIYDLNQNLIEQVSIGNISSITEDTISGNYYYSSWGTGLFSYNPRSKKSTKLKLFDIKNSEVNSNNLHYIYLDTKRNLWVGSWGTGLYKYNLNTNQYAHYSLFSNNGKGSKELYNDVLTIYQDGSENLWFGTNGGGVCKVIDTEQFGFKSFKNLPNEPVWSVIKDEGKTLWVGFKGNSNIYFGGGDDDFRKIKLPESFPGNSNRSVKSGAKVIYQDSKKSIWVGGNYSLFQINKNGNSYILNNKNIPIIRDDNTKENAKITTLDESSDGTFWIGTQQKGLRKSVQPGSPKDQKFEHHLGNNRISAFLEDSNGQIWIGTYNGLLQYNKTTNNFKKYAKVQSNKNTLSSDIINSICEDSNGQIWIGTPNGLNLLIKTEKDIYFKAYQVEDGLPNNYIHSVLEDTSKNLWVSTNKGISKYSLKEKIFSNFDLTDGLSSNNFMEGVGFRSNVGELYFGGIYGLNSFIADSIKPRELPNVTITGFQIAGEEIKAGESYNDRTLLNNAIEYTDEIVLNSNENIFSIDYSPLSFNTSNSNLEYMLQGLDDEWHNSNSQTSINFSNLKPGDYIFKIRPVSKLNSENNITQLGIKILPPFWKSNKAFALYIISFIGLLFLYRFYINKQNELKTRLELSRNNRKREEEIAKMKTQFFTNIAHEFRTPLTLISGPLEFLLNNNIDANQKKAHLSTIHYHTNRLLGLVNQLLDFRKSDSGKMRLKVHEGNFSYFIKEIFLSFNDLAESKDIDFTLQLPQENIALTYDFNKLEIVFSNLLSNAFKYAKSKVSVEVEINENSCHILVFDDGKGMSEEMLDRIFDRFYQISNSDSSDLIGSGIGLSLVKNIIELHKGSVKVESKIDMGSTFTLSIPRGDTHFTKDQFVQNFKKSEDSFFYKPERILKPEQALKENKELNSNLPKMLVVDDNPEILTFISSIFNTSYNVTVASNGKLGFDHAKNEVPDVIISDLMMPEMDGLEFTDQIRSENKTMHIPIIMLTARTTETFQEKSYTSGVDLYVTKPFNPNVLKAQVVALLNSRNKLKKYFGNKVNLLPTEPSEIGSMDQEFLNKVMRLVEDNLTNEKLGREFIANKMSVSPSTLYRKIKAITDLDITLFIRSIRLKRAAQMIRNKEDNISGIAYRVGFNDPKYFRKCFVKQFGVNPSQFNKK
ncbi:two-component regulator propeller domain-containing protein [Urechidicola vernalis]|uniref:histidine kinase n=1 Tax=Urechidicola vernalis TaxID=3075600 RepID=A0ABU2Y3S5_9FLAO|nr:two-component regulator propeller domain-containing protein [Urechidicola sp. P050]MDT0552687.1 two-component regulator propeller domain-containing protein [Urechidicola sp. P050]